MSVAIPTPPLTPFEAASRMRAARIRLMKAKDHDAALELQHATRAHQNAVRDHLYLVTATPAPAPLDRLEAFFASLT